MIRSTDIELHRQRRLNELRLLLDELRRPGIDQRVWRGQLQSLDNSSHTSGHSYADTCPLTDTCPPPALENEKPHCKNDPKLAI